jgi:hypothetical protein
MAIFRPLERVITLHAVCMLGIGEGGHKKSSVVRGYEQKRYNAEKFSVIQSSQLDSPHLSLLLIGLDQGLDHDMCAA